jgi:RNA polymerase sigma-70 factor (ECF subfamily)
MLPAEESGLVQRLRAGDRAAFDAVFREHYPVLVGLAETLLRERAAAEDVAQDVMLELWKRRESLAIESSLRGYLIRATRNRTLNDIRHRKVTERAQAADLDLPLVPRADAATMERELAGRLKQALDRLPPRCREVFGLSRVRGLRYSEIAEAMGISVKTVEAQMGKALKLLREDLAQWL